MKMILGEKPEFSYCSLEDGDSSEKLEKKIKESVNWKSESELLVLVDIYMSSHVEVQLHNYYLVKRNYLIAELVSAIGYGSICTT